MRRLDPNNPFDLLPAALATDPDLVVCLPVFHPADPNGTLVLSAKRRVRRLPPDLAARIVQAEHDKAGPIPIGPTTPPTHIEVGRLLLTVPADVAENLRGPAADRHPMFLMMVHRSFYTEAVRQANSGIILPSSAVAAGGRIVKP